MRGPALAVLVAGAALAAAAAAWMADAGAGASETSRLSPASAARVDRFNERRAFGFLKRQVALGPRPAGSRASARLAAILRRTVPRGRYQPVRSGLRNVIGTVRGRNPRRLLVVGAHYDTKDLPGFIGANDGASATAVVLEVARTLRPRTLRPTVVFVFFDGEESPRGVPDERFEAAGLRGSKVAARAFRRAEAALVLDMIGDKSLSIPREANSDRRLWARLRAAARRVGFARVFPPGTGPAVLDDHVPFLRVGVPAVDVIDFTFPCWHRRCDDLTAVSPRSLDAVGETVLEFLRRY